MKVSIVTCFESNEIRASFVQKACNKMGHDTTVYTSDFSHIKKKHRNSIPQSFIAIKTKPYTRNLSISRIISHLDFSRKVFNRIRENVPDLIWVMAPANSLIKKAKQFKEEHPEVKIIIDIIDMWPESLPIKMKKDFFLFKIWRGFRKNSINCADRIISECELYNSILSNETNKIIETIYWSKESNKSYVKNTISDTPLSLCYLGSINNIIDIDKIHQIICSFKTSVDLHIIGDGETTELFIERLSKICNVKYYGAIWDENQKSAIMKNCHAGINIYKDNLFIGLTVKCIDYFENSLPIINNIKGDTWDMVEKNKLGINVRNNVNCSKEDIIKLRLDNEHIFRFFKESFSEEAFINKCSRAINEVIG